MQNITRILIPILPAFIVGKITFLQISIILFPVQFLGIYNFVVRNSQIIDVILAFSLCFIFRLSIKENLRPRMALSLQLPSLMGFLKFVSLGSATLFTFIIGEVDFVEKFQDSYSEKAENLNFISNSTLLISVLYAPIVEELIFRHFLYRYYLRYGKTFSILLTAFIFAAGHMPFIDLNLYNLKVVLAYLPLGILFALIYHHYGLVTVILVHMSNNALSRLLQPSIIDELPYLTAGIGIFIVVAAPFGLLYLRKTIKDGTDFFLQKPRH